MEDKITPAEIKKAGLVWLRDDEDEKGNKTIVEFSGVSVEPIDDSVFSKAYLENLSK